MERKLYRIIFIILVCIFLINIIVFYTWSDYITDDVFVIQPDLENMKVTTKLYFVFEDNLRNETRTITVKNEEFEKSIFEELLIGPKMKSYSEVLPENIKIISFEIIDNIVYINFNSVFIDNDWYNEDNFYLHIMSFVNTLTELKHSLKIQFLIEGERITDEIYGINIMEPFTRDERVIYKRDETSADIVIQFIELLFNNRYELAYEYLNEDSKKMYSFIDFKEFIQAYTYNHIGYQRNIYFTQNYSENDIVTVKFVEIDSEELNPLEIIEHWKVVKDKGNFKIDIRESDIEEGVKK